MTNAQYVEWFTKENPRLEFTDIVNKANNTIGRPVTIPSLMKKYQSIGNKREGMGFDDLALKLRASDRWAWFEQKLWLKKTV